MFNQRDLTPAEQAELDRLNTAVTTAIKQRRDWLDKKMVETSRLQVGDDIYDLKTGQKLGVVARLERYWRDRDDGIRDTSNSCYYVYETSAPYATIRSFDNTSRQYIRVGTKEDAVDAAKRALDRLSRD